MTSTSSPPRLNQIVSWMDVTADTQSLADTVAPLGPWRGLVAIARGGLIPATLLARALDVRLVESLCMASYVGQTPGAVTVLKNPDPAVVGDGDGWLLVDDLADTGATLTVAREILPKAHIATLYVKPQGAALVDSFVRTVDQDVWIDFPWEADA